MEYFILANDIEKAYDEHTQFKSHRKLDRNHFFEVKHKAIKFIHEKAGNGMDNMSVKSYGWLELILSHSGIDTKKYPALSCTIIPSLEYLLSGTILMYKDKKWEEKLKRKK